MMGAGAENGIPRLAKSGLLGLSRLVSPPSISVLRLNQVLNFGLKGGKGFRQVTVKEGELPPHDVTVRCRNEGAWASIAEHVLGSFLGTFSGLLGTFRVLCDSAVHPEKGGK